MGLSPVMAWAAIGVSDRDSRRSLAPQRSFFLDYSGQCDRLPSSWVVGRSVVYRRPRMYTSIAMITEVFLTSFYAFIDQITNI